MHDLTILRLCWLKQISIIKKKDVKSKFAYTCEGDKYRKKGNLFVGISHDKKMNTKIFYWGSKVATSR